MRPAVTTVAQPGSPDCARPPLLSACMIVRDEEANLASCLPSLAGVVDEIVVYDTGSVDGTRDAARAAGATVIEGYWDDDFGRARNAALAACRGTWVLHIDADESFDGDADALRRYLTGVDDVDKLDLPIDNLDSDGTCVVFSHFAARIFRRERAWWAGRLHEQVVPRSGQSELVGRKTDVIRLRHTGYAAEVIQARGKYARNTRLAAAEVEAGTGDRSLALTNLGRSLAAEERYDEAVARFEEARAVAVEPVVLRLALRGGAEALLNSGRADRALAWIDDLRAASDRADMADYLEAMARVNLGQLEEALVVLGRVGEIADQDGVAYPAQLLAVRRGIVLAGTGRWDEAAQVLVGVVSHGDVAEPVWAPLAEACWRSGVPYGAAAAGADPARLVSIAGQLLNAPPPAADGMLEALWACHPSDVRLVALAVSLAPHLDLERALVWAMRIRAVGLAQRCPLVAIADDRTGDPLARLRAASVAVSAFHDERAAVAVTAVARSLPEDRLGDALAELGIVAPEVLPEFVAAAATSATRTRTLARLLHDFGAEEEATVLLEHASLVGS